MTLCNRLIRCLVKKYRVFLDLIINLSKSSHKVIKYILSLSFTSLIIYLSALIITILCLICVCQFDKRVKHNMKQCRNKVLNKSLFKVLLLIYIILCTVTFISYHNYQSKQHYNYEANKYEDKLKDKTKIKHSIYDEKYIVYYFNVHKNNKYMNQGKYIRSCLLPLNSHNREAYKDSSKLLINKNVNNKKLSKTLFLEYYKHSRSVIIEPDSKHVNDLWKRYNKILGQIGIADDIVDGQKDNVGVANMSIQTNYLHKLPYVIYKIKCISSPSLNTSSFFHMYHIYKLPKVDYYNNLHYNNLPKSIYISRKITMNNIKKSLNFNKKKINDIRYKHKLRSDKKKVDYFSIKGISKYVDTCNFKFFIQFLMILILISFMTNLYQSSYYLYEFFMLKYLYSNKNSAYTCDNIRILSFNLNNYQDTFKILENCKISIWDNIINNMKYLRNDICSWNFRQFLNNIKLIIDDYVFKLIPLVIAVMSGMFALYSRDKPSGLFEVLIQFTIPILSSIQFFRLVMKLCKNSRNNNRK